MDSELGDDLRSIETIAGAIRQSNQRNQQMRTRDEVQEVGHLDARVFAGQLVDNITDEVALEGLDGITFQALKVRLELRPNFEIEGFEDVASALWNQMKRSKNFTYHLLPVPRPDLVPYAWDQYRDERGSVFEPLHSPEEIYPYFPVEDKGNGIRGSCEHYQNRRDISHLVRRMSYVKIIHLFGNRLVIVAAQALREKALLGANFKKYQGLTIVQYCILERVARSRYNGEITRGKISLTCMKIPPKNLFYQRKMLLQEKLMLRQNGSIKFVNCKCPAQITVFHLPRFYRRVESQASLNARKIFAMLNNSEDKCIPVEFVISNYGKHTLRGIQNQFPTLLETAWFQKEEELDEDSHIEEEEEEEKDEEEPKKSTKIRTIRVLKLKVTDVAVQTQIIKKALEGQTAEDEKEGGDGANDDDCEDILNVNSANSYSNIEIFRKPHHYTNLSDCYFLFKTLFRAGTKGLTLSDFGFLSLTQLESRSASRFLVRHNACKEGVVKLHKQKAFTFTLNNFASQGIRINVALQEKFSQALSDISSIRKLAEKKKSSRRKRTNLPQREEQPSTCDSDFLKDGSSDMMFNFSDALPMSTPIEVDMKPPVNFIQEAMPKEKKDKKKGKKTSPLKKRPSPQKSLSPTKLSVDSETTVSPSTISSPVKMPSLCLVQVPEPLDVCENTPNLLVEQTSFVTSKIQKRSKESSSSFLKNINEGQQEIPISIDIETRTEPSSESIVDVSQTLQSDAELQVDHDFEEDICSEEPGQQSTRKMDSVDHDIKSRLNRQRVDWKEHEDYFILIGYIATNLFIPKCNLTKIFVFNSMQIRDLLLKKTNGKATKTSAAIRRRIHFLMHQKHFFDRYIGLMGAAVRDEGLYETHLKPYLHPPQPKIYINPQDEALENVMNYLYEKFNSSELIIIDTRASVNELEAITFLRQLKRTEFYWKALIFSIFCPMGKQPSQRAKLKLMWKKYSKSEDDAFVVTTTGGSNADISEEQEDDLEVVESETEGEEEKKSPDEYYTEYCYRFFKFLLKQLKIVFNNILMFGSVGNKKEFQLISFDPNLINFGSAGSAPNICFSSRECLTDLEIRLWGARCLILEYVMSGDTSKVLDKSVMTSTKLPLDKATSSLTSAKVLVCSKRTGLLVLSRNILKQFVSGLTSHSYEQTVDFLTCIDETSNVDSLACISVGILYGIVELSDFFKSSINLMESIFTLNNEWAPVYDGISLEEETSRDAFSFMTSADTIKTKGQQRKSRKRKTSSDSIDTDEVPLTTDSSHQLKRARLTVQEEENIENLIGCFEEIEKNMFVRLEKTNVGLEEGENYICSSTNALRLLRIRLNQAGVHMPRKQFTGFVEKDFFTINLPNLEFIFPRRNDLNRGIAGLPDPYPNAIGETLKELRSLLLELVYHNVEKNTHTESTHVKHIEKHLRKYWILFQLINLAGKVGVSGRFLMRKFEYQSLLKGLRYLLNSKLIFSVGILERRFVSYNNANDWIIPIRNFGNSSSTVGHVIIRPWITSLGAISWQTIDRLFISIIGQLQKPAMLLDELCEVMSPVLSPVEVIILVETLVKLRFVTLYKIHEDEPTMLSKHQKHKAKIEYNVDTLIDLENVFVCISPYAIFLFAQLHQTIKNSCMKRQPTSVERKTHGDKYLFNKKRRAPKAKTKVKVTDDDEKQSQKV